MYQSFSTFFAEIFPYPPDIFLRGGAIQPGDGPNKGEKILVGRGGGGGDFGCLGLNCVASLQLGPLGDGAHLERVNVCLLGGSPETFLN